MEIKPFGINLLIRPIEEDAIIKSSEGNLCEYGEILAIGNEYIPKDYGLNVGDIIAFTKWGCKHVDIKGVRHYFILIDNRFILGKVLNYVK